jgi:hypothetical protein
MTVSINPNSGAGFTREELLELLTRSVTMGQGVQRPTLSRMLLDQLLAECLRSGELQLGLAALLIHTAVAEGDLDLSLRALLAAALERTDPK